jgi:hypothetical protein
MPADHPCWFLWQIRCDCPDHYNQVPPFVKLQHLVQETDDLRRANAFVKQAKEQPALATQGRHRRHAAPLPSYRHPRSLATHRPGLAQESRQRDVGFVLKVQNRPELPHYSADLWHFGSQPFLTSLLVYLEILPLRLLISQASVAQTPPDRIVGNPDLTNVLDYLLQASHGPEISLIPKVGGRKHYDLAQIVFVQVIQQSWSATTGSPLKTFRAIRLIVSDPPKQRRPINIKCGRNLANSQAPFHSFHCANPNLKGRVPSLAHDQERTTIRSCPSRSMLQIYCDEP